MSFAPELSHSFENCASLTKNLSSYLVILTIEVIWRKGYIKRQGNDVMIFAVITILAVLMFAMMMSMGSMMVMPSPSRVRVAVVVKRKR